MAKSKRDKSGENMKTPKKPKFDHPGKDKELSKQTAKIAALASKSLVAVEEIGIGNKPLAHFWLSPAQRDVLLGDPGVSESIKSKLAKANASFTYAEVTGMALALLENVPGGDARKQAASLLVAKHILERLYEETVGLATKEAAKSKGTKTKMSATTVFQFKITLAGH